jgi:predicted PurR-regulated permease PerM
MNSNKNNLTIIYLIFGIATLIGFFIIKDYLTALFLGSFIAMITYPLYNLYLKSTIHLHWKKIIQVFYKTKSDVDENRALAAVGTVVTSIGIILLSVYLVGIFAGSNLKFIFEQPVEQQVIELIQNPAVKERFGDFYNENEAKLKVTEFFNQYKPSKILSTQGTKIIVDSESRLTLQKYATLLFTNIFNFLIYFIIFIFTWIIMLISGQDLIKFAYKFTGLDEEEQKSINTDVNSGVRNVIIGNTVSGAMIALVVAIVGIYFHIPLVSVWSILAFFIGFLPLSPSEAAFIPVLIGIFFMHGLTTLLVVMIAVEIYILILNNAVLPKITAGKETNPLLILISVFSAINMFGIPGFVIGPVFVYFMMALYKIAENRLSKQKNT